MRDEYLLENKNEFEKDEPEKENENFVKIHEDHKKGRRETEIDNIEKSEGESCKELEENDEERRPLMEFRGNFKNAKRDQSLCYEKAQMSFSSTLTLINLLFSFKELKLFEFYNYNPHIKENVILSVGDG
ncbi:hypothetical protein M9H77_08478 [Catharanthus roseus]|uniref:Uncharacterized protein n=1 Tax=Catharanthus roseus TaxID=4058 RepID=A0ACC0BXW8_CATRO|nr:hypothetical protein M9H77_08478 [Catharanthus roseus]